MTTIAFDGKTVAADRQVTVGGTPVKAPFPKITRVTYRGVKSIVGFTCGNVCHVMPVIEWIKNECPMDDAPDIHNEGKDFSLMLVNADGVFYSSESLILVPLGMVKWAVGSGSDFALGAMAAGANAKRAVTLTMGLDVSTGMGIDVLKVLAK